MSITAQQASFVIHYCANGGNGTQAAIAAGYSKKTSRCQASRLLTYDNIKKAVKDHSAIAAERSLVTIDTLLAELESSRKIALNQDTPQCSAAINATMAKAKLLGLDQPTDRESREPQPLDITFTVKEPISDMYITRGK